MASGQTRNSRPLGLRAQGVAPLAGLRAIDGDENRAFIARRARASGRAVERKPLQRDHRRARNALARRERLSSARADRHTVARVLPARARRLGDLRRIDGAEEKEHVLSDDPADGINSKDRNERARRRRFLPGTAPRGRSPPAALDPPPPALDQIALAERKVGAEPELADQHDLIAVEIAMMTTTRLIRTVSRSIVPRRASRDSARSDGPPPRSPACH